MKLSVKAMVGMVRDDMDLNKVITELSEGRYGVLADCASGEQLRFATKNEFKKSLKSKHGILIVEGQEVYVDFL